MQGPQKQINISVQKIYNWPKTKNNYVFELIFLPIDSNIPLIEKSVIGTYYQNAMNLNTSLKITYTDDENIVILKIQKITKNNIKELLGDFQINLDMLKIKKIQYFSFSDGYVLQINLYTPNKQSRKQYKNDLIVKNHPPSRCQSNYQLSNYHKYPIRTQTLDNKPKYQHLKTNSYYNQYNQQKKYHPLHYQSKEKKSFSEKVNLLLQQVKQIKQDMQIGSKKIDQPTTMKNNRNDNHKIIKKSMSEGKYSVYGVVLKPEKDKKEELRKTQQNQKHRLILNTGNVVACDQYYQNQKQTQIPKSKPQIYSKQQKYSTKINNNKKNDYYLSNC